VKRRLAALLLALLLAGPSWAVEPGERLADPALEGRARALSKELRCLVCQNESIDDSGADLAHDLRVLLRERIKSGDTDQQAMQYLVRRYGDFVLLRPPIKPTTYVLWFSPLLVLVLGGAGIAAYLRRHRPVPGTAPPPLDAAERKRLERLLREGEA
jgi:cytochrome c-type biogenesis protein CcmH